MISIITTKYLVARIWSHTTFHRTEKEVRMLNIFGINDEMIESLGQ